MDSHVDPTLLQLLALGVDADGDPYLRSGKHLRWLPSPFLGFPRRGFVLRRRSAALWPWHKRKDVRRAPLTEVVKDQDDLWHPSGVRLRGGVARVETGRIPLGRELRLRFQEDETDPGFRPACWVALKLQTAAPRAEVRARAIALGGPEGGGQVLDDKTGRVLALPRWGGPGAPTGRNAPRVLLLRGSTIDEVRVRATAAVDLLEIWWIDVQDYADKATWTNERRFLLPINGDGVDYPSLNRPQRLARGRVLAQLPKALPPWENDTWPPSLANLGALRTRLGQRYLRPTDLLSLEQRLLDLLDREITEKTPQGLISLSGTDALQFDQGGQASLEMPMLPTLMAQAMDPGLAHLLGLGVVDRAPPSAPNIVDFDYLLTCVWPRMWLQAFTTPQILDAIGAAPLPRELLVPPLHTSADPVPDHFFRALSIAPGVREGDPEPVPVPDRMTARVVPRAGRDPVPSEVELAWNGPDASARNPVVVGSTVRRRDATEDISLARTDPETGLHLLRLDGGPERRHFVDRALKTLGPTTYRVSSMDIWGRWSDFAELDVDVVDRVPPPPPVAVQAEFDGDPDRSGQFATMTTSFDWTAAQQALAPDTEEFTVHVRAGRHEAEGVLAQPDTVATIAWPSLGIAGGGSATSVSGPDGDRIDVVLSDVGTTLRDHRREASVVVLAKDRHGNASRASRRAMAIWVDPAQPSVPRAPQDVQFTTWPDAENLGWWRAEWSAPTDGTRVQVMRADESRLLALSGQTRSASGDGTLEERARILRDLAVLHPHAFVPDHRQSFDHTVHSHQVGIPSGNRGLTLVVVVPTGPTGSRAAWPTDPRAFAVIAARRWARPQTPTFRAARAPGGVALTVGSGGPGTVRMWRAEDPDQANDVRDMRPLEPLPVGPGEVTVVDDDVQPDTWYGYRAAMEGGDGLRSELSEVVWVRG